MPLAFQSPISTPAVLVFLLVLAILVAGTIELNVGPLKITFRKRRRRRRR
jgi:hypothetical protein